MSRTIDVSDPSSLSEQDRLYLQDRNRLPEGAEPVRIAVPEGPVLADTPNFGDVNTPKPDPGGPPPPKVPGDDELLDDYDDLSTDDLRDALENRGLTKSGNKQALIDRLRADDRGEEE